MSELSIDAKKKLISLNLDLKGEMECITINIIDYKILVNKNETYMQFGKIDTSRQWLNVVIENYIENIVPNRKLLIPVEYAKVISVVL